MTRGQHRERPERPGQHEINATWSSVRAVARVVRESARRRKTPPPEFRALELHLEGWPTDVGGCGRVGEAGGGGAISGNGQERYLAPRRGRVSIFCHLPAAGVPGDSRRV